MNNLGFKSSQGYVDVNPINGGRESLMQAVCFINGKYYKMQFRVKSNNTDRCEYYTFEQHKRGTQLMPGNDPDYVFFSDEEYDSGAIPAEDEYESLYKPIDKFLQKPIDRPLYEESKVTRYHGHGYRHHRKKSILKNVNPKLSITRSKDSGVESNRESDFTAHVCRAKTRSIARNVGSHDEDGYSADTESGNEHAGNSSENVGYYYTDNEVSFTDNEVSFTDNEVSFIHKTDAFTDNKDAFTDNVVAFTDNEVSSTDNDVYHSADNGFDNSSIADNARDGIDCISTPDNASGASGMNAHGCQSNATHTTEFDRPNDSHSGQGISSKSAASGRECQGTSSSTNSVISTIALFEDKIKTAHEKRKASTAIATRTDSYSSSTSDSRDISPTVFVVSGAGGLRRVDSDLQHSEHTDKDVSEIPTDSESGVGASSSTDHKCPGLMFVAYGNGDVHQDNEHLNRKAVDICSPTSLASNDNLNPTASKEEIDTLSPDTSDVTISSQNEAIAPDADDEAETETDPKTITNDRTNDTIRHSEIGFDSTLVNAKEEGASVDMVTGMYCCADTSANNANAKSVDPETGIPYIGDTYVNVAMETVGPIPIDISIDAETNKLINSEVTPSGLDVNAEIEDAVSALTRNFAALSLTTKKVDTITDNTRVDNVGGYYRDYAYVAKTDADFENPATAIAETTDETAVTENGNSSATDNVTHEESDAQDNDDEFYIHDKRVYYRASDNARVSNYEIFYTVYDTDHMFDSDTFYSDPEDNDNSNVQSQRINVRANLVIVDQDGVSEQSDISQDSETVYSDATSEVGGSDTASDLVPSDTYSEPGWPDVSSDSEPYEADNCFNADVEYKESVFHDVANLYTTDEDFNDTLSDANSGENTYSD